MKVFLVRHGIAADQSPDGSDEGRPLTEEGIAALQAQAETLARLDIAWDLIFTSPLIRARQTAAIFAAGLSGRAPVEVTPTLAPPVDPALVAAALQGRSDCRRVALVGHEPGMGILAAHWLGTRAPIIFKKGGICRLDIEPPFWAGAATLRWFAPPKILRALDP